VADVPSGLSLTPTHEIKKKAGQNREAGCYAIGDDHVVEKKRGLKDYWRPGGPEEKR
jgi:hypothetical protein